MTIRHTGTAAAYRDLRYVTGYRTVSGVPVRMGQGKVYEVLQPGETLTVPAFNEGYVDSLAARAEFRVVGAEKLVPIPPSPLGRGDEDPVEVGPLLIAELDDVQHLSSRHVHDRHPRRLPDRGVRDRGRRLRAAQREVRAAGVR
jgi:hypothetical protein